MIKKFSIFLLAASFGCIIYAQEPSAARLQRTPEEEAIKQTERLVRELGIQDSVRIDTLYKMHLKYAHLRRTGLTRAQEMDRMNAIVSELKVLLTPNEFEQFMNHPAEQPRRPRGANVMQRAPGRPTEAADKPAPPTELR